MKTNLLLARAWSALAAVALISAACVPIPDSPPPVVAPTASVLLPNVEAPGVTTSPLQPTAAPTSSVLVSTTAVPISMLPAASATPTPGATPLATHTATPTATPLPSLIGPLWQWVSSTLKDGPSLAPSDPGRYTFQLLGDGNALIQADCNFGTGSYTESANSFSFTAIGTTKMACPPDSQDSAFLAQLRYISSFRFEAGELVITLQDDAGTMRLRPGPAEAAAGAAVTEAAPVPTDTPGSAAALATSTVTPLSTPTPLRTETPVPMLLGTPVPLPSPVAAATVLPALSGTN